MKYLFCLLLVLICVSCKNSKGPEKKILSETFGNPVGAKLDDPECNASKAVNSLGLLDVFIKGDDFESRSFSDFSSFSGNPVSSKSISGVFHSEVFEKTYRYYDIINQVVLESEKIESRSVPLYVCSEDRSFTDSSIEGQALSALFTIGMAYKFYEFATGDHFLTPISVNVNSISKEIIIKESPDLIAMGVINNIDHAFYSFKNKSISFLPQKKNNSFYGKSPAWRIPFVVAHEVGHHILNYLFPAGSEQLAIVDILDFYNREIARSDNKYKKEYFKQLLKLKADEKTIGFINVFLSYHEAFADLFAYVSLGKDFNSLSGVTCMEETREVNSKYFQGSVSEKILSNDALSKYLQGIETGDGTCKAIDYSNPIIIGSILAYGMNQMMEISNLDRAVKFRLLIKWIGLLQARLPFMRDFGPKKYFKESLKLFFTTMEKNLPPNTNFSSKYVLVKEHCDQVDTIFPGLSYNTQYSEDTGICKIKSN